MVGLEGGGGSKQGPLKTASEGFGVQGAPRTLRAPSTRDVASPSDEGQASPLQGGRGVEGSAWSMAEGRVGSPGASRGVRDGDEWREVGEAGVQCFWGPGA